MRRGLSAFDFTLLVLGAVVGADIYVVAGFGASLLGPAQLVAWATSGVLAGLIALAFVQCAVVLPKVGGSYAYTREAFGPFAGFLAGWALYLGEWVALPIFPLTFVRYLSYFVPGLSGFSAAAVTAALISAVTVSNLVGVKSGGKLNDVLTVAKLAPLGVLIVAGLAFALVHQGQSVSHLRPFAPLGWNHLGAAVLLIFWAFAGFELAVLPAAEVENPQRVMPMGLILGMGVATVFYLLSSFAVVVALPWQQTAGSAHPLADSLRALFSAFGLPGGAGSVLMTAGALVSIVGVYEVFSLALARLSYAMALDGLFPPPLARLHPRFGTPYWGLAFQALGALVVSLFLMIQSLISIAVFFLGIAYVATALSALRLVARQPRLALHVPRLRILLALAGIGGAFLSAQTEPRLLLLGLAAMLVGALLYWLRQETWALERQRREGRLHVAELEEWVRAREAWLLRSVRRGAPEHPPGK